MWPRGRALPTRLRDEMRSSWYKITAVPLTIRLQLYYVGARIRACTMHCDTPQASVHSDSSRRYDNTAVAPAARAPQKAPLRRAVTVVRPSAPACQCEPLPVAATHVPTSVRADHSPGGTNFAPTSSTTSPCVRCSRTTTAQAVKVLGSMGGWRWHRNSLATCTYLLSMT